MEGLKLLKIIAETIVLKILMYNHINKFQRVNDE